MNIHDVAIGWPIDGDGWSVSPGVPWCKEGNRVRIGKWVKIGKDCQIGDGCVLGKKVELCDRCVVDDGSEIPPYCFFGDDFHVKNKTKLRFRTLDEKK